MEKELIQETLLKFCPKKSFCILCKGRVVSINFDEITHVCKYGNESVIHTTNDKFRVYSSLQEILDDLPVNQFFRISRSHIVSLQFMKGVKDNKVIMGEYCLPLTKYYRQQISKKLAEILNQNYHFIKKNDRKIQATIL